MADKDIVIKPYLGIADSPMAENAYSFKIDNDSIPGAARINVATINTPAAGIDMAGYGAYPVKFSQNYFLDSLGGFFKYNPNNTYTNVDNTSYTIGSDFVIWQGYGFLLRENRLDVVELATETFTNSFQTDPGSVCLLGRDDIIYIGYNNIIRSIERGTGAFDPTSAPTYVYNSEALNLPDGEVISSIVEYSTYLEVGTELGNIYLWDRVSPSFELPTRINDRVAIMIPVNNFTFVISDKGDIYQSNGSSTELIKLFPQHLLANNPTPQLVFNHNAWRVDGSKIFFGMGSTFATSPVGVYSYDYLSGDFKFEYGISTGAIGETSNTKVLIGALSQYDVNYPLFFIGWKVDDSTTGLDRLNTKLGHYATSALVYSPLYKIGTKRGFRTVKQWEVSLADKIKTGAAVTVSYRTGLDQNWITIGTFNQLNEYTKTFDKTVEGLSYLQVKIEMTSTGTYTPTLLEVRIS